MESNILLEGAPETVIIDKREIPIDTRWQVGIRVLIALDDPRLSEEEKIYLLLLNYYSEAGGTINPFILSNVEEAISRVSLFLNLNQKKKPKYINNKEKEHVTRTFDWNYDAPKVISDFQREYSIDLLNPRCEMHWWRFWALFTNLSDTSQTIQVISIRGAKPNKNMSKNEKDLLKRRQQEVLLPARTEEEALHLTNFVWSING